MYTPCVTFLSFRGIKKRDFCCRKKSIWYAVPTEYRVPSILWPCFPRPRSSSRSRFFPLATVSTFFCIDLVSQPNCSHRAQRNVPSQQHIVADSNVKTIHLTYLCHLHQGERMRVARRKYPPRRTLGSVPQGECHGIEFRSPIESAATETTTSTRNCSGWGRYRELLR